MKVVINREWGGFALPLSLKYLYDKYETYDKELRTNPDLIKWVEEDGDVAETGYTFGTTLKVANIPDDVTDFCIEDYDGMETVIYVLNGKMHRTNGKDRQCCTD